MNRVGLICILAVMPILLSAASDSLQIHSAGQSVAIIVMTPYKNSKTPWLVAVI
jgi:hypothetical protein